MENTPVGNSGLTCEIPGEMQDRPRVPVFTYTIILLNFLIYIAMILRGVSPLDPAAEILVDWGARYGPDILEGEWWRLVVSMFVHIGLFHVVFNMFVLWYIGKLLEPLFGSTSFGLLYLYSGIMASMLGALLEPEVVSAGASGAIFGTFGGLIGYLVLNRRWVDHGIRRVMLRSVLPLVFLNLIIGFLSEGIDNVAHAAGLMAGVFLGILMAGNFRMNPIRLALRRVVLMSLATMLVMFVLMSFTSRLRGITNEALDLYERGEYENAIQLLNTIISDERLFGYARLLRADCYDQLGRDLPAHEDYREAIGHYERVIRVDPDHKTARCLLSDAYYSDGLILKTLGRYADAAVLFGDYIRLNPGLEQGYQHRADCRLKLGLFIFAISDYKKILAIHPGDSETLASLARSYYQHGLQAMEQGRVKRAILDFNSYIEQFPDDSGGYTARAQCYHSLNQKEDAIQDLQKAMDLESGSQALHLLKGLIHLMDGRYEEALAALQTYLDVYPEDDYGWYCRAEVYILMDRLEEAEGDLDRAIELKPNPSRYHHIRGFIRYMADRLDAAREDWETAAELALRGSRTRSESLECLVLISLKQQDWHAALAQVSSIMDIRHSLKWLWLYKAIAEWKLGLEEEARTSHEHWISKAAAADMQEIVRLLPAALHGLVESLPGSMEN
jgi:membrane associated rhomboid family serine protease/Flp pilus assembly protein TadD